MTVIANAGLVLKDSQGNKGIVKSLTDNDIDKISNAITDVGQVVDPATHMPIEATTASVGVVQLATAQDITNGTANKVVDAKELADAIADKATKAELAEIAEKSNAITVSDTAPNVSTMPVASGVLHPSQDIITETPDVSILALQQDMWAYDSTKTYAVGSYIFDANKDICKCIQANGPTNIHAPNDTAYWEKVATASDLVNFANKNLSNVTAPTQAFKDLVLSWLTPDLTAGITQTWNTAIKATSNGFVCLFGNGNAGNIISNLELSNDGNTWKTVISSYCSIDNCNNQSIFFIPKGLYYRASGGAYNQSVIFYPCVGGIKNV